MKNFLRNSLFILLFWALSSYAGVCEKQFYDQHEVGWFYKKLCEKEKKKEKKEKKKEEKSVYLTETTLNIPFKELDKYDPDRIRELQEKARKIVIMYPTDHNIKQYQKLVNYITNKSLIFMENWMRVSRTDTELAREAASVPVSSISRQEYFTSKANYTKQVLNQFKDRAGLVVVVEQGCPYCERQKQILQWFKAETGWEYKLVDIKSVPNMVKKFGIARVPDIFLVVKADNGKPLWIRIGTGLHTKDELKDLILFGLYNLGLIEPEKKDYVLY